MKLFCFVLFSSLGTPWHCMRSVLYPLKVLSSSPFTGTFNFWYFHTDSISVNMKLLQAQPNKDFFFSAPQQFVSLWLSWEHNLRSHSRHLLKLFVCNSLPDPLKNNCQLTCSPSLKKSPRRASSLLDEFFEPIRPIWSGQETVQESF